MDGKKFRAHRSILAANSDFFLNLFRAAEDQTNFVLAGVPVRGFSVLLDFCYTNSFTLEPSNVTEVYRAASVLNFSHISSACEKGKHIWSIHRHPPKRDDGLPLYLGEPNMIEPSKRIIFLAERYSG